MSAVIVLAAGAGRRLGGVAKAALRLADGRSYLEAIRDIGRAAGVTDWVVVCGPPHEQVTRDLSHALGLPCSRNSDPTRGMASSVAIGFAHALTNWPHHRAALLWPVDHPAVQSTTVRALIDQSVAAGAVIPRYADRGGHPSAFGRAVWPALASCHQLPQGARSVVQQLEQATVAGASPVSRPQFDDPGLVRDVDTPDALSRMNGFRPSEPAGTAAGSRSCGD